VAAAAQHAVSREERLWAEEVARVREAAASLELAAWIRVHLVLVSLANDRGESPETRRDALDLLEILDQFGPPPAA
jgi:hypothetical protein